MLLSCICDKMDRKIVILYVLFVCILVAGQDAGQYPPSTVATATVATATAATATAATAATATAAVDSYYPPQASSTWTSKSRSSRIPAPTAGLHSSSHKTTKTRRSSTTAATTAGEVDDFFSNLTQLGNIVDSILPSILPGLLDSTPTPNTKSSGLSDVAKIAMGVAIPVGVIIIAVAFFLVYKLRIRRYARSMMYEDDLYQRHAITTTIGGAGEMPAMPPVLVRPSAPPPTYSELPENRFNQPK